MDKQKYYVSVQAKTIMAEQGDAAYELEIEATPEELEQLNDLFRELDDFDVSTYFRAHIPGIPYHHDLENDGYDYYLQAIYRFLYEHGTEQTRDHVLAMNILA